MTRGLKIGHINIRGIYRKLDEIKLLISDHNFKILFVTETFLKPDIPSTLLNIANFQLVRRDRVGKHGGGVLAYIHNSVPFQHLNLLQSILPETISLKICQPYTKPYILSAIYRPPNKTQDWTLDFTTYTNSCRQLCDEVCLVGDFNIDLTNNTNRKWSIEISKLGLTQLVTEPTRVTQSTSTLIDHIYTSHDNHHCDTGVIRTGISDHYLTYTHRKLGNISQHHSSSKTERNVLTYLDWKTFNTTDYLLDLSKINWTECLCAPDVDTMLHIFTYKLKSCINTHLKTKKRYVKSNQLPPWLDTEVLNSIKHRDALKRLNLPDYRRARNYTTNLIKRKKSSYIDSMVKDSDGRQTKRLWDVIQNRQHSTSTPSFTDTKTPNGVSTEYATANCLNDHFTDLSNHLLHNAQPQHIISGLPHTDKPCTVSNHLPPISVHNVVLILDSIKTNKATGHDLLSPKILKISIPFIVQPITDIINRSIEEGIFPNQWKVAEIRPVHKGGLSSDPNNYRPISVLPTLSKIFERHILKHLTLHLEDNDVISDSQSGFRPKHSCLTAMHKNISDWTDQLKTKNHVLLIFLDFCKAFDMVNHNILLRKLSSIGVTGKFYQILQSYLSDRTQLVKIGSTVSRKRTVTTGVPQGSLLGPTLFQIYINDLLQLKLNMSVHAYADDTSFYTSDLSTSCLQLKAQHDLRIIQTWCHENGMIINMKKSHFLICSPPTAKIPQNLRLELNGEDLTQKHSTKLLGFIVNEKLSWDDHISVIHNKISTNLKLFYLTRHLMSYRTARTFYLNFIHTYLTYGIHIYFQLAPKRLTEELFLQQKKAIRLIKRARLKDRHSTNTLCSNTNILPLTKLSEYFALLFAHRIITKRSPNYILSLYPTRQNNYSQRTTNLHTLPSSAQYNPLNRKTVLLFNSLPIQLRAINSPSTFKRRIKTHLFQTIT